MKTYRFDCRSTPGGFTQWCIAKEDGVEVKRIDRDVTQETVRQFYERCEAALQPEGFVPEEHQYTL